MSDTYRGKHAGGKYVYGELVFKSDSPFINDGDGLVGVFASTVQVKAGNKWADITDSLYFSLRDNFHIGQIDHLRTRLSAAEKRAVEAENHNGELREDWTKMFEEGDHFLSDLSLDLNYPGDRDLDFENLKKFVIAGWKAKTDAEFDAWKWSECYARLCATSGKTKTLTFRKAKEVADKYAALANQQEDAE